jgi:hypothetical protein
MAHARNRGLPFGSHLRDLPLADATRSDPAFSPVGGRPPSAGPQPASFHIADRAARARPSPSARHADVAAHDLKGDALHALWGAQEVLLAEPHDTRAGEKRRGPADFGLGLAGPTENSDGKDGPAGCQLASTHSAKSWPFGIGSARSSRGQAGADALDLPVLSWEGG